MLHSRSVSPKYELFGVGVIFLGTLLLFDGALWLIRNAYRTAEEEAGITNAG